MKCHFAASYSPEIARPPCLLSARITVPNFSKNEEAYGHVANASNSYEDTRTHAPGNACYSRMRVRLPEVTVTAETASVALWFCDQEEDKWLNFCM